MHRIAARLVSALLIAGFIADPTLASGLRPFAATPIAPPAYSLKELTQRINGMTLFFGQSLCQPSSLFSGAENQWPKRKLLAFFFAGTALASLWYSHSAGVPPTVLAPHLFGTATGLGTLAAVGLPLPPSWRPFRNWRALAAALLAGAIGFFTLTHHSHRDIPKRAPSRIEHVQRSARLAAYDKTLEELSEKPAAERWSKLERPVVSYDIKGLYRIYESVEGRKGVMIAVGFPQNLALIPHVQPDQIVFIDINPAINEVMLPLLGQLLGEAPTRRAFLSLVWGIPLTEEDVRQLLESNPPSGASTSNAEKMRDLLAAHLDDVLRPLRNRSSTSIPYSKDGKYIPHVFDLYNTEILSRIPVTTAQNDEMQSWLGNFLAIFEDRGIYLENTMPRWLTRDAAKRRQMAGWLSTEENYYAVRQSWMKGQWIGVTGDIRGPSASKVARWLDRGPVTAAFISCVPSDIEIIEKSPSGAQRVFEALGRLPLARDAMTVGAYGRRHDVAYARPYRLAAWTYAYLNTTDRFLRGNVIENPLIAGTNQGTDQFYTELLGGVEQEMNLRNIPHDRETLGGYGRLVQQIRSSRNQLRTMDPAQFTGWALQVSPSLDAQTDIFRAVVIALVETGAIQPPAVVAGKKAPAESSWCSNQRPSSRLATLIKKDP